MILSKSQTVLWNAMMEYQFRYLDLKAILSNCFMLFIPVFISSKHLKIRSNLQHCGRSWHARKMLASYSKIFCKYLMWNRKKCSLHRIDLKEAIEPVSMYVLLHPALVDCVILSVFGVFSSVQQFSHVQLSATPWA